MSITHHQPTMRGLFSYRLSDGALRYFITPVIDRDELKIFPFEDEAVRGKWAEIDEKNYLLIYLIDSKNLMVEHVRDIVKQMTAALNIKFEAIVDTRGNEILYV